MTTSTEEIKTSVAAKKAAKKAEFVSKEEFNQLTDLMKTLVDTVTDLKKTTATPTQKAEIKEVEKAAQDQAPVNPNWEEKAREIVGEALDHCEIFYPKNGGQIFTVVIRPEFSNAPKEYMERMKADRRSREIGNEGIAGVEIWCKLIRQNLKRTANN